MIPAPISPRASEQLDALEANTRRLVQSARRTLLTDSQRADLLEASDRLVDAIVSQARAFQCEVHRQFDSQPSELAIKGARGLRAGRGRS